MQAYLSLYSRLGEDCSQPLYCHVAIIQASEEVVKIHFEKEGEKNEAQTTLKRDK